MIPVVKSNWVTVSLGGSSSKKPAPLRPYTPDPNLIFSGITVTCADIPDSDKDAIIGAVLAMGGQDVSGLTKMVTHIVALNEENAICKQVRAKGLKVKIVLPHWYANLLL
jgi:hypothetical protein